jgi:hypothetical protein
MSEKMGNGGEILFTRHSKAKYGTYGEAVKSENPEAPHDPNRQLENDLPEAGIELARKKAEELFATMNPETDALFFASSKEMRAFETAKIYRDIAKEKGFEIIIPYTEENKEKKSGITRKLADENIKAIDSLSLKIPNSLVGNVFNPEAYLGEINWSAVDEETKRKWKEAREIINSDDQGSWGANFYKHSEAIQKIFPEIKSSRDEYATTFQKLLRLTEFAQNKIKEVGHGKNVKVLSFGHENYMGYAMNKYLGDHNLGNCETISIDVDGKELIKKRS